MFSIIIPDLHGDFDEFCNILHVYGILKERTNQYISNMMISGSYKTDLNMHGKRVIQLGDILDSKDRKEASTYSICYSDMLLFTFICKFKEAFPSQVILIMGNHELLNCRQVFDYVSKYSRRNKQHYEYILKNVLELFQYSYIDELDNLFIHACIPVEISSKYILTEVDEYIKRYMTKMSNNDFGKLYNLLFTREYASVPLLSKLKVNRVFFGHIPHEQVYVIDNRIFYVDTMISRSFATMLDTYQCVSIDESNTVSIDKIGRYVRYIK